MENIVIISSCMQDHENLIKKIESNYDAKVSIFEVEDWNQDLSPWPFNEFGNGADQTLKQLQAAYDLSNTYLIGYSLAGLFCLWASFQCEIKGIGCCSSSLWFENFISYMDRPCYANAVYFSLGKKEKKTRNPLLKNIEVLTEEAYRKIMSKNIPCILEMNNGNHFYEVEMRQWKAIEWLMAQKNAI